ncbi:hypothetical protein VTO42DRAFT_2317 [Malbranchea cinnamomea]
MYKDQSARLSLGLPYVIETGLHSRRYKSLNAHAVVSTTTWETKKTPRADMVKDEPEYVSNVPSKLAKGRVDAPEEDAF